MPLSSAIIPAAGESTRFGGEVRKPYVVVSDKPILFHTLSRFHTIADIHEIILSVNAADVEWLQDEWAAELSEYKVTSIVVGGERRQDSVTNALAVVSHESKLVLIHDAVRPLIREDIILQALQRADATGAVILAVPMKATVKKAGTDKKIICTLPRGDLWMAQTPQVFEKSLILDAYKHAEEMGIETTDDAEIVERFGHTVEIVEGSYDNIKITTQVDLQLVRNAILRS